MTATDKNNSSAGSNTVEQPAGGRWVRRLAPIVVLCGGLGVALFAGTRTRTPDVASSEVAAPVDIAQQPAAVAQARPLTTEYQPSQFAGVMVRGLPDAATSSSKVSARWVVPPGGKRPASTISPYDPSTQPKAKAISLGAAKGISRAIPESLRMERIHQKNVKLNKTQR